jgi:myo-inositol 2-dehydrogenase/D-chiro-inositol 1-dehydrogenase
MMSLRAAIIGCGGMGSMHARALRRHVGELVCCDVVPARADALARAVGGVVIPSVEEVIAAGVDAAVVATATARHHEVVTALLEAGIPTFCEKPLAMTLAETVAIGRVADRRRVLLQVGFHRRFDPGYVAVARTVREGGVGRVNLVRAGTHEAPHRAVPVELCGSVLRDLLIHDFDAVRLVTGADALAVASGGVEGHSGVGDGRDWPAVACLVELDDGSLAVVTGGRPHPPGYDARIEVYGSTGSIAAGVDERTPTWRRDGSAAPPYRDFADRFHEAYDAEIAGFLAALRGGQNRCPWPDAYAALRLSIAAERALVEGRRVTLAEVE